MRGGHTTFALVPRSVGDASSENKEDAHALNTSTTKLQHYKKEEAEWPAVLSVMVLYRTWKSQAGRPSFHWTTHDQPVAFDAVCALPMMQIGIGMHINSAIGPDASPRRVVDEQHVSAPVKAAHSPTPGTESRRNDGAETKTDRSTDDNSAPRRIENHEWIIDRHADECRIHRVDLNVGTTGHDDFVVAAQIRGLIAVAASTILSMPGWEQPTTITSPSEVLLMTFSHGLRSEVFCLRWRSRGHFSSPHNLNPSLTARCESRLGVKGWKTFLASRYRLRRRCFTLSTTPDGACATRLGCCSSVHTRV